MQDIWVRMNENIPKYFGLISQKYNLRIVKISSTKTAIVGSKFAIIILIGKFTVDVYYATRIGSSKEILNCGSFLAEKYSLENRQDLLKNDEAESIIINELKVISSGLVSKWETILLGDLNWIAEFKNSRWYSKAYLTQDESEILWKLIQ